MLLVVIIIVFCVSAIGSYYLSWPILFLSVNFVVLFAGIIAAFYFRDKVNRILIVMYLVIYTVYFLLMLVSSYTGLMLLPTAMAVLPLLLAPYLRKEEARET